MDTWTLNPKALVYTSSETEMDLTLYREKRDPSSCNSADVGTDMEDRRTLQFRMNPHIPLGMLPALEPRLWRASCM